VRMINFYLFALITGSHFAGLLFKLADKLDSSSIMNRLIIERRYLSLLNYMKAVYVVIVTPCS